MTNTPPPATATEAPAKEKSIPIGQLAEKMLAMPLPMSIRAAAGLHREEDDHKSRREALLAWINATGVNDAVLILLDALAE